MIRLALLIAALTAPTALGFELSEGGKHLLGVNAVIGIGSGATLLAGGLFRGGDLLLTAGAAAGLVTVFLGGGLTAAHLLEPSPPMAWSSFFAGVAGAGVGLGFVVFTKPQAAGLDFDQLMLAMGAGYVVAALLDLACPGRSTMSWKEFWVPMVVSIVPGAIIMVAGIPGHAWRDPVFAAVAIGYPVASFLVTRLILSIVQPFDPWYDDLLPPFRAEPIIALSPSGATVGLAAIW